MLEENLYDLLIIGAHPDNFIIIKKLLLKNNSLKIGIISTAITQDYLDKKKLKVKLISKEPKFIEYFHKILCVTLNEKNPTLAKLCSKNIILAPEAKYKPLLIGKKLVPHVYYNINTLPKLAKNNQIVILGNSNEAAKAALTLSKKINYVYLCLPEDSLYCVDTLAKQLNFTENIAILPNSKINGYTINKSNFLSSITLDPYNKIHCTSILALNDKVTPKLNIQPNLVTYDKNNKIIVDKNGCTTVVPNIYALGDIATKYTKSSKDKIYEQICKNNKW